jgi:hypothetical protein
MQLLSSAGMLEIGVTTGSGRRRTDCKQQQQTRRLLWLLIAQRRSTATRLIVIYPVSAPSTTYIDRSSHISSRLDSVVNMQAPPISGQVIDR